MCCFVILLLSNEMQMSVRRFSAIPHLRAQPTIKINRSIKLVCFCKYSQVFFNRKGKYKRKNLSYVPKPVEKGTTFATYGVCMEKLEY